MKNYFTTAINLFGMKKQLLFAFVIASSLSTVKAQKEISDAAQYYRSTVNARMAVDAEIFQATIKQGANANQFLIYIRPNQIIPVGSVFAGGAPQVAFSVLGGTAVFTPTFNLGVSGVSTSTEVAGGRSRMVVGASAGTNTLALPWPAGEERLAFTVNIAGDDTVGARIEHDFVTLGQYTLYVADVTTFSDWTHYTTPLYASPGGNLSTEGIYVYATIPSGILPVIFSNFNAGCNDKGTILSWGTASEQNSDRFEIQRSTNSIDWVIIDNVAAVGNSDILRNYQYLDLKGGFAFYRIRQVDIDGRFIYTAIKPTDCKVSLFDITLYPVPANDKLTVVIKSDQAVKTDLQIVDINGRTVSRTVTQINKGNNNITLNVSQLPGGEYILSSSDPSIIINRKFTVIR